jgi:ABC-2 type transport system permease protein
MFYWHLLRTSIRSSISLRGVFLLETFLMVGNNFIFFILWWIFFRQFNDIAGWTLREMSALLAIGIGAYGLNQIFCGGTKRLSNTIVSGELDAFLTQPKNVLLHIVASKSYGKGWGHLLTAIILVFLEGLTDLPTLAILALGLICGCLVFTSAFIMAHSLAFWMGPIDSLSRKYCDSLYVFATYPTHIYSGLLQTTLFTLIPAGVISCLPVELLRSFEWKTFALLLGSASLFVFLAFLVFNLGLRRYESGNTFTPRA